MRSNWVNWQQEELAGFDGRRQPSMGGTSRISREVYVRICERLGVQVPGATRRFANAACALIVWDVCFESRIPHCRSFWSVARRGAGARIAY